MEKSESAAFERQTVHAGHKADRDPAPRRFGPLSALVRIVIALAIVGAAGYQAISWISDRPEPPARQNRERTFTVAAADAAFGTHRADISTYGQVATASTVGLRSQVQGRVVSVSDAFAVGNRVSEGDVLVEIDAFAYEGALIEAQANLANAELTLSEARQARALEEQNIETAEAALEAAQTDLERARSLVQSGAATQQTVDTRALTVAERRQALNERQSNLFTLDAEITRAAAAIEQARWQVETAQRDLESTTIRAPFDGVVTERLVTAGGFVSANEEMGGLYDVSALDVSFTVSDRQYGQLSAAGLEGRPLVIRWDIDAAPVDVPGTISRTAAQVESSTGGVTLFASLDPQQASRLRPGAFVSVAIEGIAHEDTLRIPETAVYDDDHIYVIREGRMARADVEIVARDNAHLIVDADIAPGERIITTRLSQAGDGVAVVVEGEEPEAGGGGGPGGWGGGRP
ncbi:efflux RND transporter periplasmic adaptor subunit [Pelagibacterium montanilacus]|uniref:efflux RND transporter periplasmic adaptor subunit n=1 Tax=Pelagibacterium montanilacus TaxID=2185280 RepID=UPI000F8CB7AC|nr:efflux RND transporter periplasmic adaptor subunit [Pelagibacterium montanilacus]